MLQTTANLINSSLTTKNLKLSDNQLDVCKGRCFQWYVVEIKSKLNRLPSSLDILFLFKKFVCGKVRNMHAKQSPFSLKENIVSHIKCKGLDTIPTMGRIKSNKYAQNNAKRAQILHNCFKLEKQRVLSYIYYQKYLLISFFLSLASYQL